MNNFKECSDVSTTMIVLESLPNFMSLCVLLVNSKNRPKPAVFGCRPAFKTHNDIKFGKEVKMIIGVDTSLHFFKNIHLQNYIIIY